MNSVNDNPIVAPEHEQVCHTANFMGYYVSAACDMLRADIAQAATWGRPPRSRGRRSGEVTGP